MKKCFLLTLLIAGSLLSAQVFDKLTIQKLEFSERNDDVLVFRELMNDLKKQVDIDNDNIVKVMGYINGMLSSSKENRKFYYELRPQF